MDGNPTPLRFDRYRVKSELGQGGYGVVYRCADPVMNRDVAVKKFDRRAITALAEVKELHVPGRLEHANIVTIYDVLDHDGAIVMEFVPGGSLRSRMNLDPEWVKEHGISIILDVAEGLRAAHSAGILHLDIKPDNILLTGDGRAKLADFGVCKLIESSEYADGPAGTLPYMALEVLDGSGYRYEADVHSLGCVTYEIYSGRLPWIANGGLLAYALTKANKPPQSLRERNSEVGDLVSKVVARMITNGPDRIKNIDVVIQHLLAVNPAGSGSLKTIDDLQIHLGAIYGFANAERTPLYLLSQYLISVRSAANSLRSGPDVGALERLLPKAFAWLCACTTSVNLRLAQAIWLKYESSCPYCGRDVCACTDQWSRDDQSRNEDLLDAMASRQVNQASDPKSFAEYQAQFDRMFGDANRKEGLEATINHAYSEIAEAMDAVIHLLPHERDRTLLAMQLEFSDLVAWFFALTNFVGDDFDLAACVLDLFANGCYACDSQQCVCPEPLGVSEWRKALNVVPDYEK